MTLAEKVFALRAVPPFDTVEAAMLAGRRGYRPLAISRGKFFTLVNECPSLLVGFFQLPLLGVDYAGTWPESAGMRRDRVIAPPT